MSLNRASQRWSKCMQCTKHDRLNLPLRTFSTSAGRSLETLESTPSEAPAPPPPASAPNTSSSSLQSTPRPSVTGPRRRRAAIHASNNIPFHQLPYQCFQEARNVIQDDRREKVEEITVMRERIARLKEQEVARGNEAQHEHRLRSMRKHLHTLKIHADINDPLVKKNFEDGVGDMNKTIYRHLALQQWHAYKRKVLMQRIQQMNVVPDILPFIDPTVSTALAFPKPTNARFTAKIAHGAFVPSLTSLRPPVLSIQPYDAGARLVTIAVVTPDVPNVAKDGFDYRCHFLASNVRLSPTETEVNLAELNPETQVVLDWLPPYSQRGAPYQRLGISILEQPLSNTPLPAQSTNTATDTATDTDTNTTRSQTLPMSAIKEDDRYTTRENFVLRSFVDKYRLQPVGVDLFRTVWDEGTEEVMLGAGIAGADVEFRRKRIEPLPYKRLKAERYR